MHKHRIQLLIKKMEEKGLDSLLITKPENIFYLTGFDATKIVMVVSIGPQRQ